MDEREVVDWLNKHECMPIKTTKLLQATALMQRIVDEMGGCDPAKCNGHSIVFGQQTLDMARQWLGKQ